MIDLTDQGPNGPCGQSMSMTCPKCAVHVFHDESAMRKFLEGRPFYGKKPEFR